MTESLPSLIISGIDDLPTLVPHLCGFHPSSSIVLLGMRGPRSQIAITVRVDLPVPGESIDTALECAEPALFGLVNAAVDEVILVVYPAAEDDPWRGGSLHPLPHKELLDRLEAILGGIRVGVRDMLCIGAERQRSYLCGNPTCCPAEGRPRADVGSSLVGATFVGLGSAPLDSRAALVQTLAPRADADPVRVAVRRGAERVFIRLAAGLPERADQFVTDLRRSSLDPRNVTTRRRLAATVGHLVATIPSRDLLLRLLTTTPDRALLATARDVMAEAIRCAEPGEVAPLAATLGVCAWVDGDGAAAWVALDRALADDPGYSLTTLIITALQQGQPPWIWTSMMANLSVEEILAAGGIDAGRSSA